MLGMSDRTAPIDKASLQHGLAQILKCYSASGVKRFNRHSDSDVPLSLLQSISGGSSIAPASNSVAAVKSEPAQVALRSEAAANVPVPPVHPSESSPAETSPASVAHTRPPALDLDVSATATSAPMAIAQHG